MNPEIKSKWIESLRSDKYKQGKTFLKYNDRFCCLGVLCDIHARETNNQWTDLNEYMEKQATLPEEVIVWAGLDDAIGSYGYKSDSYLIEDNDSGKSFKEIADIIEKQF